MTLLDQALDAVRRRSFEARVRGIELIGVFGSVARGDATTDSDVDIAYDIVGRASLLDVAHYMLALQEDLGRTVDLVDISEVKPRIRAAIEQDLVKP